MVVTSALWSVGRRGAGVLVAGWVVVGGGGGVWTSEVSAVDRGGGGRRWAGKIGGKQQTTRSYSKSVPWCRRVTPSL